MPVKRRNVPEHLRRAIRLAISVGIAAATGFALLEPLGGWHSKWGSQTMMGTKWAAITSVVCNAPVIAKTTEVAMERVLGTVTGGLLGYGLAMVNDKLPFLDQPFFTVLAATAVAFSSIIMGYKLRLDYSGRLFIMTFILVVMAAPKTEDAFVVAVTRISGIIFGVITTMVMSVIVFPKSASHQATDNLQAGLAALARLNAVAWKREAGCTAVADIMRGPSTQGLHSLGRSTSDQDSINIRIGAEDPILDDDEEGVDRCCDAALSEVYAKLSACQEFTAMSKSETYVFTSRGRWCFFPAFKCLPWRTALPDREMSQVTAGARKVARLLWCLHTSLPEANDGAVLGRYHGALGFLNSLGVSLQVYLENLAESFPNQQALDTYQLYTFIEGVETLITASHRASRDSTILLRSPWLAEEQPRNGKAIPKSAAAARQANGVGIHQAFSAPGMLCDRNEAFICEANGAVTRVSGSRLKPEQSTPQEVSTGNQEGQHGERFSPISELLPEGSQTQAVLTAAAAAAEADSQTLDIAEGLGTKQGYIAQVRWQATQFLLRRLTRELTIMNSTFIRLSVLLPPTRWESRRRRAEQKTGSELREPLLESGQHHDRQPVVSP